jgi:hypothetical protein
MSDDWRLRIELASHDDARRLARQLGDRELEHDLERTYGETVVVSVDGAQVFCYCGTRRQAQAAARLIDDIARREGLNPDVQLGRWHPLSERWEDPDAPLPADADDGKASIERGERLADERIESAEQGYPDFEVRVDLPSRHAAGELSRRLDEEGLAHVRRWSTILIGAADEAAAAELADRLRAQTGGEAGVTVGRNERAIYDALPHPFAVLGGMGG